MNERIYALAVASGCSPIWHDGIFGWAWHCNCDDGLHGSDQQCSTISLRSAQKRRDAMSDDATNDERMFEIECHPVEGGWVASCEETGLSAFGRTADSASTKLIEMNAKKRAKA